MFERIFIYSSEVRKRNKIPGIMQAIKLTFILFPAGILAAGLFSCYIKYIPPDIYRKVLYVIYILLMCIIVTAAVRWLKELFTVYAIDGDGKFYRLKMMSFAMSYMGFGGKVREAYSVQKGRLTGTMELMSKIKATVDNLEDEEQIDNLFAQGYMTMVSDMHVIWEKRGKIKIEVTFNEKNRAKTRKIVIRRVYDDWKNLSGYIKFYSDNGNHDSVYKFDDSVTVEDIQERRYTYAGRVLRQSAAAAGVMLWIAMIVLGGDISCESSIRAGKYVELEDNVYYSTDDPDKYIEYEDDEHINYKPILVIFLVCETLIATINIDMSEIFSGRVD